MFSQGKIIIAIAFFVSFLVIVIIAYRQDKRRSPAYFKGTGKIILSILGFIGLLFLAKFLLGL